MSFVSGRGCVAQVVQEAPPQVCPPGTRWSGTACLVPRDEWVRRMNAALPSKICTLPIFQRCFRATIPECERIVASLGDACMAERNLPGFFDEPTGNREGEAVGRCIGNAYEANMRSRHRVSAAPECQSP